jgi:hypothetical protein
VSALAVYDRAPARRKAVLATSHAYYDLAAGLWQQTRRDLAHGWRAWLPLPTPAMPVPVPRTLGLDAFWWLHTEDFVWWCDAMPADAPPEAFRRVLLTAWPPGAPVPPAPAASETAAHFRQRCLS